MRLLDRAREREQEKRAGIQANAVTIATGVDQGRGANLLWDASTLRKGLQRQIFSSLVEMTGSRILVVEQTARELARLVNPRSPAEGLKALYAGFDDPTPIQHLLVYRTDPRTTIQHQIWWAEEFAQTNGVYHTILLDEEATGRYDQLMDSFCTGPSAPRTDRRRGARTPHAITICQAATIDGKIIVSPDQDFQRTAWPRTQLGQTRDSVRDAIDLPRWRLYVSQQMFRIEENQSGSDHMVVDQIPVNERRRIIETLIERNIEVQGPPPHGGSQGGATLGFSDAMNALIDEELVNAQANKVILIHRRKPGCRGNQPAPRWRDALARHSGWDEPRGTATARPEWLRVVAVGGANRPAKGSRIQRRRGQYTRRHARPRADGDRRDSDKRAARGRPQGPVGADGGARGDGCGVDPGSADRACTETGALCTGGSSANRSCI